MTNQLDLLQRDWCERAEPVILARMAGRMFTADDLHPILDPPEHWNWFGILMAALKRRGLVGRIGYQPSKRPEANGRPVAVWRIL